MQDNTIEHLKVAATHGAAVAADGLKSAAAETKHEISAVWANTDERNDLIRVGAICLAVLVGVSLLVTLTGWLPAWARVVLIFATLGALTKWVMGRISDSSDD